MLDETFAGLDGGRLTARQADCIALVAKGLSSKEIARELGISPSTVDNHIASAMHLFGFPNRSAVAKWYQQYRESACANLGALPVESIAPPPPISNPQPNVRFSIPTIGGIRNSLSLKERLSAIGQVMIVSTMVTSAVVVSVLGLIFLLHQPTQGL